MQVKELRQEIGVTQKRLAETSGLDFRWIQKVESGEINTENITVKRFFSLLNFIIRFPFLLSLSSALFQRDLTQAV